MLKQTFNFVSRLLAAGVLVAAGQAVLAASSETASGTTISNTATVSYSVGTVAQTPATATREFVVDNKVDFTVANTSGATVVPNAASQVLTFTVTNTGNTIQGYGLQAVASTVDDFDASNVRIYIENGAAGFDGSETLYTAGNAGDLDPYATDSMTVYVVAEIPPNGGGTAPGDGSTAAYDLIAVTLDAGTATATVETTGADDAATVDVVFADGAGVADAARDGVHSATGTYTVASSALSVSKTSDVISDPFNGTTNPKAIPGATVRYSVTVANAAGASASASSVVLVDAIPSNMTYVAGSITLNAATQTDADDTDESDYDVTNSGAVTVNLGTLTAGDTHTITFDVTVD